MKKLLLLLAIFCSIGINAKTDCRATSVACSINQSEWSDWCDLNCLVSFVPETEQIIIYSDINYTNRTFSINNKVSQILDYTNITTTSGINNQGASYTMKTLNCTDRFNSNCTAMLLIFNDGNFMLIIQYNNITYKYMLQCL